MYERILKEAQEAGMKVFKECVPVPVSWVSADLFGKHLSEPSPPDLEGECDGAFITNIHGKDPFIVWAKKHNPNLINKGVYKGYAMYLKIDNYNGQSAAKKKAFAEAYAKVLNANGIKCGVRTYLT